MPVVLRTVRSQHGGTLHPLTKPTGGCVESSSAATARNRAGPLPDGHGQERAVGLHLSRGPRQDQEAMRRALQVCQDAASGQEEGGEEGGSGGRKWRSGIPAPRPRAKKMNHIWSPNGSAHPAPAACAKKAQFFTVKRFTTTFLQQMLNVRSTRCACTYSTCLDGGGECMRACRNLCVLSVSFVRTGWGGMVKAREED